MTESEIQEKCRSLTSREVIYCVSSLFTELGQCSVEESNWGDEYRSLVYPIEENCGCNMDEEEKQEAQEEGEELEPCGSCFSEIFEQWIVSEWLGRKLQERGERVVDFMNMTVWARTTTGQAIYMDGVIRDLAVSL